MLGDVVTCECVCGVAFCFQGLDLGTCVCELALCFREPQFERCNMVSLAGAVASLVLADAVERMFSGDALLATRDACIYACVGR